MLGVYPTRNKGGGGGGKKKKRPEARWTIYNVLYGPLYITAQVVPAYDDACDMHVPYLALPYLALPYPAERPASLGPQPSLSLSRAEIGLG